MKDYYRKLIKGFASFQKSLKKLALNLIEDFKKDLSFYSKYTEMLAIWTVLFLIICGFFVLAIKNGILAILVFFTLSISISLVFYFFAINYIQNIKNKKHVLAKIHNIFNKSFKLRSLLIYIKIPHKLKNLKSVIKLNFKFAP